MLDEGRWKCEGRKQEAKQGTHQASDGSWKPVDLLHQGGFNGAQQPAGRHRRGSVNFNWRTLVPLVNNNVLKCTSVIQEGGDTNNLQNKNTEI